MDLSRYFTRSDSDASSSVNPRSVLYKNRGSSRQLRDRESLKGHRRDTRRLNMDRLRGIHSIAEEDEEQQEEEEENHSVGEKDVRDTQRADKKAPSTRKGKRNIVEEQKKILNRLAEFRLRKQRERDLEAKGKKPAFKVGLVHHKPYPFDAPKSCIAPKKPSKEKSASTHDTKTKTYMSKAGVKGQNPSKEEEISSSEKALSPFDTKEEEEHVSTGQSSSSVKENMQTNHQTSPERGEPPCKEMEDIIFKTPLQPPSRSSRRRSTVSPLLDGLRTDICFNRGNSSDLRRAKKGLPPKLTSPLHTFIQEIDSKDALVRKALFEGKEVKEKPLFEQPKDVSVFRKLYSDTINKLTALADVWDVVEAPSEELQGRLSAVVGKARLIMGKKGRLDQFKSLVDNCEFGLGEKETNKEDLRGFWDMISFQIEGIVSEFQELENLKARDWQKEVEQPSLKKNKKKKEPSAVHPPVKKKKASSALRAMLKEKRSQMMKKSNDSPSAPSLSESSKNFDGGFFQVSSPIRPTSSPKKGTTSQPSTPLRKTPDGNSSAYLRKSLLMSSVIRVSSSARRSLLITPTLDQENKQVPSVRRRSSRRLTASFLGVQSESQEEGGKDPGTAMKEDLIVFETPEPLTPRRSKRLSCKMTPISYKL